MSKQSLKVTINYTPETEVEIQQWPLKPGGNIEESNRLSVQTNGLSYCFVLDKNKPSVEVWNLDKNNELKDIVAHFRLPAPTE